MMESLATRQDGPNGMRVGGDLFVCDDPSKRWCVLHTKSRREKKIAEQCGRSGIRYYLPLRKSVTGCRGRRYVAMVPIFSGYVFAYLDWTGRKRLYQTNHIARVIDVVDQGRLLDELRSVRRVEESGSFLYPLTSITKGTSVRIIDGPLAGLQGKVCRVKSKHCVVLEVDIIKQAVACEIDAGMVVPT
jgi:transcription antitermination factor NusG